MKGQTLVEVVVVIALVIVLVTGIVSGTTTSLSQNKDTQIRSSAIRYAQEGIEFARYEREKGWDTFAGLGNPSTIYCVGSDRVFIEQTGDCGTNIHGSPFSRQITMTLLDAETPSPSMLVEAKVGWGAESLKVTTNLLKLQ